MALYILKEAVLSQGRFGKILLPEVMGLLLRKITRPQEPLMPRHVSLEAWVDEEGSRIRQLIEQLPLTSEKEWEALDRFFLAELERR